ncbi:M23 family metallopeptidase [Dokdonia sinensis]|uniref:M23 family metallopeptidase n=1 Tax=Dokdonia sinensis TaxID=2479847 RepID=A0A3M0FY59_9FLAO|nr:M23 family metallopeptidase [Dokdonia sinensis]RMB57455.1 M23 family metallopeptidase [Dokdonia sinensis]
MPIRTKLTASRAGTVVHVEESGGDFGFPNNLVVVKSGNTYAQYMHLTKDGAIVEVGDQVTAGQEIGLSGATGLAGYPHLHFVITQGGWEYPYQSVPHNFRNTRENPYGPESGLLYEAMPY